MSKSYEWNIFGRAVRAYLSDLREDFEKGWHGRFTLYLDESGRRVFSVEYHVPSHHISVRFHAGHDEAPIKASFNVGLFGVYLGVEHPAFAKVRDAVIRMWPLKRQLSKYSGRDFSLAVHDHAVWWTVGADDAGWASETPRWRQGSWHPIGRNMRQGEPELIEEREVLVPMPERSYRAKARLERTNWGFSKLPRRFDRVDRHVHINMLDGEQIPFPGKGENSWDCGDDAVFSISVPGDSIEDGIGEIVASVLRSRRRNLQRRRRHHEAREALRGAPRPRHRARGLGRPG